MPVPTRRCRRFFRPAQGAGQGVPCGDGGNTFKVPVEICRPLHPAIRAPHIRHSLRGVFGKFRPVASARRARQQLFLPHAISHPCSAMAFLALHRPRVPPVAPEDRGVLACKQGWHIRAFEAARPVFSAVVQKVLQS